MDEILLLGHGVNANVSFEIEPDRSGIVLHAFDFKGVRWKVMKRRKYEPWQWGRVNQGAGQLGTYLLMNSKGEYALATIRDYRALEGDWRIVLVDFGAM